MDGNSIRLFAHFHLSGLLSISVQSNTICAAFEEAFNISPALMGCILTALTLIIIFGGIQRIAKVSSIIVHHGLWGIFFLALFHRDYECQTFAGSH